MKKLRKVLYVVIIFAMILQVVPVLGGGIVASASLPAPDSIRPFAEIPGAIAAPVRSSDFMDFTLGQPVPDRALGWTWMYGRVSDVPIPIGEVVEFGSGGPRAMRFSNMPATTHNEPITFNGDGGQIGNVAHRTVMQTQVLMSGPFASNDVMFQLWTRANAAMRTQLLRLYGDGSIAVAGHDHGGGYPTPILDVTWVNNQWITVSVYMRRNADGSHYHVIVLEGPGITGAGVVDDRFEYSFENDRGTERANWFYRFGDLGANEAIYLGAHAWYPWNGVDTSFVPPCDCNGDCSVYCECVICECNINNCNCDIPPPPPPVAPPAESYSAAHPGRARATIPVRQDTHVTGWLGAAGDFENDNSTVGATSEFLEARAERIIYLDFDASEFAEYRNHIESVTLRMYLAGFRWSFLELHDAVPITLFDAWPNGSVRDSSWDSGSPAEYLWDGNIGTLWVADTLSFASANAGQAVTHGRDVIPHLQPSIPFDRAFTARETGAPGALITAFGIPRGSSGWVEVDITEYVINSMAPAGFRYTDVSQGTGWGRNGNINIAMRPHDFHGGSPSRRTMLFHSSRNPSNNAPEIVVNFASNASVPTNYSVVTIEPRDQATVSTADVINAIPTEDGVRAAFLDAGNLPGNTTPIVVGDTLSVGHGPASEWAFTASFLQFDMEEYFDKIAAGYSLVSAELRLTAQSGSGPDERHPRVVSVSLANDNWDGETATFESFFAMRRFRSNNMQPLSSWQEGYPGLVQMPAHNPTRVYMPMPRYEREAAPGGIASAFALDGADVVYLNVTEAMNFIDSTQTFDRQDPFPNDRQHYVYPVPNIIDMTANPVQGTYQPFPMNDAHPEILSFMLEKVGPATAGLTWGGDGIAFGYGGTFTNFYSMTVGNDGDSRRPQLILTFAPNGFTDVEINAGRTEVTVSGRNTSDDPITATLVMAMFNTNGRFLAFDRQTVTIPANSVGEVELAPVTIVNRHANTARVRAFLWDEFDEMIPHNVPIADR